MTSKPFSAVFVLAMLLSALLPAAQAPAQATGAMDVREFGAVGDGAADDTEAFNRALAAIGDDPATLRVPAGTYAVGDLVFPQNATLQFASGGRLLIAAESEVAVHGAIEAGIAQIFSGEGTVTGRIANLHVYPQWFGARGDGEHDDAPALQQAADLAATSMGRTLFIPGGEYVFGSSVDFRCNVESQGLLVRNIVIDEARTTTPAGSPLPTHYATADARIRFLSDHPEVELDMEPFYGVQEGDLSVPVSRGLALASGEGTVDLAEGGTLRFYSSDFFSSRNNGKGDQWYDRNDIMQVVTGMGDVFPEFAFSYDRPPDADEWSPDRQYVKGDYVSWRGEIFKATWPSGEGSGYTHRFLGAVEFGGVEPDPDAATTLHRYEYANGVADSIMVWRKVRTHVWYREKDAPLTVNGLRVEIRLADNTGEFRRVRSGAVSVNRSNMTFNNFEVAVRDREAMMSSLVGVGRCVNVEFNKGYVSGATYHGLGYNLLNSNAANIRYNDCVSTNSRKGMDGRHGKNITVQGGFYNVIEDHYGRNMVIRDVVVSGLSTFIPGYRTPDVDLAGWGFRPRRPFGMSGANLHIENVVVDRAAGGIFGVRGDIGDMYGRVVIKNVSVRRNAGDVTVFSHRIARGFDYAHRVRWPDNLVIEDILLENPGGLRFDFGSGFPEGDYGPVQVRNVGPITQVRSNSPSLSFFHCEFDGANFGVLPGGKVHFFNCVFAGANTGLGEGDVGVASGNAARKGAMLSFPLNYFNPEAYVDSETVMRRAKALREILDRWGFLPDVPKEEFSPTLEFQGDTDFAEVGPAGVALVIPVPEGNEPHGAFVRRHPALFPEGPFSLEVAINPDERFYEKIADSRWQRRAMLVDTMTVDYVHQNPGTESKHGYQMELRHVDEGRVRVSVSLGFGRDEPLAVYQTAPLALEPGEWHRILFAYDGQGTGRIYLDGELAAEATHEGKAGILPGRRDFHIGERGSSIYRSFPGMIGQVRLRHSAVEP